MKKTLALILSAALLLSACSSKSQVVSQTSAEEIEQSIGATLTAIPTTAPQPTSQPTSQPAAQPSTLPTQQATSQPASNTPVPTAVPMTTNATVGIDNLKLRLGPGFGYSARSLLPKGQAVDVLGRSSDGLWLEVLLADRSGGWVFSSYVISDLVVADLPIKEAYGGAYPAVTPVPVESIIMSIAGTTAEVQVNRFPVNAAIVAKLGLPGTIPSLLLVTGKTNDNGHVVLSFTMPAQWADGSAVTQNDLVLLVSTLNGSFSQSAEILYIH